MARADNHPGGTKQPTYGLQVKSNLLRGLRRVLVCDVTKRGILPGGGWGSQGLLSQVSSWCMSEPSPFPWLLPRAGTQTDHAACTVPNVW
jgi:hypothetical protein